jgi:septum formation protein
VTNPGEQSGLRLILASGSPRRRRLLEGLGVEVTVRPAAVVESQIPGESPAEHVQRLAESKASFRCESGELVLGADTVVVLEGAILGKPRHAAEAAAMLTRLGGREHQVLTGVALHAPHRDRTVTALERTRVRMTSLSSSEVRWYVESGEPLDKAGSYAIQGRGGLFVEWIEGSYSNVVGLPLSTTYRLFQELGLDLRSFVRE